MSWQEPKLDWGAADGVRDDDFNRIEGNIKYLHDNAFINGNITIYVSGTGNDTTGNGTNAQPYRTITKALSMLPSNFSAYAVTINIESGTYAENIVIRGFSGVINLYGGYGAEARINGLTVDGCTVSIVGVKLSIANAGNGLTVTNGGTLTSEAHITVTGGTTSVTVTKCSTFAINATLTVYDATTRAILVSHNSFLYAYTISGSDSANGMYVTKGSRLSYNILNITSTGLLITTDGGSRVLTGSQTSGSGVFANDVEVI